MKINRVVSRKKYFSEEYDVLIYLTLTAKEYEKYNTVKTKELLNIES